MGHFLNFPVKTLQRLSLGFDYLEQRHYHSLRAPLVCRNRRNSVLELVENHWIRVLIEWSISVWIELWILHSGDLIASKSWILNQIALNPTVHVLVDRVSMILIRQSVGMVLVLDERLYMLFFYSDEANILFFFAFICIYLFVIEECGPIFRLWVLRICLVGLETWAINVILSTKLRKTFHWVNCLEGWDIKLKIW